METQQTYRSHSHKSEGAVFLFLLMLIAMGLAMMSGCSTVRTTAERDNTVSFGQYRSFAWLPPDQKELHNNITARNQATLIQNAVDKELEMRGMAADTAAPDLLLRYHIGQQNYTSYHNEPVYSYASPQPFFWGRRMWYTGGGFYPVYNRTYRTVISEGVLSVDAIDRKTNNVIWRGVSSERVDNLANMTADLPKVVQAMFEKYPVQAQTSLK